MKSIKTDVIYYLTNSDFELEFNLCGCCRMRLLKDSVNDKKNYLKSLARAAARSQVLISSGPLFGENGLINITAAAIGVPLVDVDKNEFGIDSKEPIKILEGSMPLVTPDGKFGGCIIGKDIQVIVILTDNRAARKAIMKEFVHPYLENLYIDQINEKSLADIKRGVVPAQKSSHSEIKNPEDTENNNATIEDN